MNSDNSYSLDWEDEIERDSTFVLLDEGDYEFEVIGFERSRHGGSAKLPACPKAIVTVKAYDINGNTALIKHNFYLHSSCEGLICSFFTSIGLRKRGERFAMAWDKILGCTGKCKIAQRPYKGNDGNDYIANEIKKFYEPAEASDSEEAAAPAKSWQSGKF